MDSHIARIPKIIKIVVHDGRNLDYIVPESKKNAKTRRWRVIFIGGEKKQATGRIDAADGCPRWDCEVTMCPVKPIDAVCMRVIDGKERHIGQIVIKTSDITNFGAPQLVISQLNVRDLEPTRKNPTPCGQLSFWIWAEDFWPAGTLSTALELSKSHSFKGSLSQLGSAIRTRTPKDGYAHSGMSKMRHLKRGKHKSNSNIGVTGNQSIISGNSLSGVGGVGTIGADSRAFSLMSGSHGLGWASELGGDGQSGLSGNTGPSIKIPHSYNPLGTPDEDRSETDEHPMPRAASTWTLGPVETSSVQQYKQEPSNIGHHKTILGKLKTKVSKSTTNLSELGSKFKSRKSSNPSELDRDIDVDELRNGQLCDQNPMNIKNRSTLQIGQPIGLQPMAKSQSPFHQPDWETPSAHKFGPQYGLHPEEQPGKSKSEMSKRELIELSNSLEQRLTVLRTESGRWATENRELRNEVDNLNSELASARIQLTTLRSRLLEDNMTQYLEVESSNRANDYSTSLEPIIANGRGDYTANSIPNRLDQMKAMFIDRNSTNPEQTSSPNLMSRARALASKPFNANVNTSQPPIENLW